MKNKFFLLGMLAVLFAVSLPLYADPGGTVAASSISASIDQFAADIAIPAVVVESSKQTLRVAYDGPGVYSLEKRTISNRRLTTAQSGSPDKNLDSPTVVDVKAGELAKRTKSELLKRQVS